MSVPRTPRRSIDNDIDVRSEFSTYSSGSGTSKRALSVEFLYDLFDRSNVTSTPLNKRKKISKALFTLAKKWQVSNELEETVDEEEEDDENILQLLTSLVDEIQENQ